MSPNTPVRIKDELPEDASKYPGHLVHKVKGMRGVFVGKAVHDVYKREVCWVRVDDRKVWMEETWFDPDLPRGGYF